MNTFVRKRNLLLFQGGSSLVSKHNLLLFQGGTSLVSKHNLLLFRGGSSLVSKHNLLLFQGGSPLVSKHNLLLFQGGSFASSSSEQDTKPPTTQVTSMVDLITSHTLTSVQSSNFVIFRLQSVSFIHFIRKAYVMDTLELP